MRNYFNKVFFIVVFVGFVPAIAGSYDDFFRAIKQDNDKAVAALLKRGFDPNTVDPQNIPGLHLALSEPSLKVAAVLVDSKQIKLEQRNPAGETALMLAALRGHRDVVQRLLARRAEVNQPGWTALHYAAAGGHADIVQALLDRYAYIDAESPNRTTPLMMAAGYGTPQAVAVLLRGGADASLRNEKGLTAMDFARNANRSDAVALLQAPPSASAGLANPAANRPPTTAAGSATAPASAPAPAPALATASAPPHAPAAAQPTSRSTTPLANAKPPVSTSNTVPATPKGAGWGVAAPIPLPAKPAP